MARSALFPADASGKQICAEAVDSREQRAGAMDSLSAQEPPAGHREARGASPPCAPGPQQRRHLAVGWPPSPSTLLTVTTPRHTADPHSPWASTAHVLDTCPASGSWAAGQAAQRVSRAQREMSQQ